MSLVAYFLDVLLGPIGLVLNLGDLGVLANDGGRIVSMLTSGEISRSLDAVMAGEFAQSGHLVANGVGTLLWMALIGSVVGELGEFGGLGEVGELGELFEFD